MLAVGVSNNQPWQSTFSHVDAIGVGALLAFWHHKSPPMNWTFAQRLAAAVYILARTRLTAAAEFRQPDSRAEPHALLRES